jgi:lysophospholipase
VGILLANSSRPVGDEFTSGGLRLFRRSVTVERPVARVILHHGYGEHSGRYEPLMRHLATVAIESHAYDARGHGRSEGRRGYVRHWDEFPDDLRALSRLIPTDAPLFHFGHSHGGLVIVVAIERGMVTGNGAVLSAPFLASSVSVPRHKAVVAKFANVLVPWLRIKSGLSGDMMTHDDAMIEDAYNDPLLLRTATPRWFHGMLYAQAEALARAGDVKTPLLAMIGTDDVIANPVVTRQFVRHVASEDKSLIEYDHFRHELIRESGRARVFEDVSTWLVERARRATNPKEPG